MTKKEKTAIAAAARHVDAAMVATKNIDCMKALVYLHSLVPVISEHSAPIKKVAAKKAARRAPRKK